MSLKLGDNFSYQARKPLDERLTFDTLSEMISLSDSVIYTGLLAFNNETNKFYVFNVDNTVDATLGKWREFTAKPTDIPAATMVEYAPNTAYVEDTIVYLNNQIARVLNDYTSGSVTTTLDDLFNSDTNLLIMSHDVIDDTGAFIDHTYSSTKIEQMFAGVSSSFIGSAKTDSVADLPATPNKGDWLLIENCVNTHPGQAAIAVYGDSGWSISPIPAGTFEFPEPTDDGKFYFRKRDAGTQNGSWEQFTAVDGSQIELKVNIKDSSIAGQGAQIPKKGELVWDSDRECLLIGDGLLSVLNLRPFYESTFTSIDIINALGFTPESIANKGQANGYAPLDASGKVPAANLPTSLTDTYSKAEIDQKDTGILTQATALVNQEAATARANENTIRSDLNTHTNNNAIHVTQSQKDAWDAKVDSSDLTIYDNHLSDTIVHVTQSDKDKWNGMNKSYYVLNKTDLPLTGNQVGNIGFVQVSAAGVTPVVVDQYLWNGTDWVERDVAQTTLQLTWGNIQDKPSSTVLQIDNAVGIAHSHNNKAALDKIGQTATGVFTYDGKEIGVRVLFVATDKLLPAAGEEDTLYVVYEDARVRNYPSISVWRDGSYQLLGRGTQDAPQVVGDLSILQNEYFSVTANSKHKIKVKQNQYFAFLPLEILKEIPGQTNVNRTLIDFGDSSSFDFDKNLITIDQSTKLIIKIEDLPTTLDEVGEQYHSYVDVDLSKYKNIGGIA